MDTFMDKLSEKINAQEIIRANTTAELEELSQVKGQIEDVRKCVEQVQGKVDVMQTAVEQVQSAAEKMQDSAGQVQSAAEKMQDSAGQMQSAAGQFQAMAEQIKEDADKLCAQRLNAHDGACVPSMESDGGQQVVERKPIIDEDIVYIVEEEVTQLGKDLGGVKADLAGLRSDFAEVKESVAGFGNDFAEVKEGVAGFGSDFAEVKECVAGFGSDFAEVKESVAGFGSNFAEVKEGIAGVEYGFGEMKKVMDGQGAAFIDVKNGVEEVMTGVAGLDGEMRGMRTELSQLREEMTLSRETNAQIREEIALSREAKSQEDGESEIVIRELKEELTNVSSRLADVNERGLSRNAESLEALKNYLISQMDQIKRDLNAGADQTAVTEALKGLLEEMKSAQTENGAHLEEKLTGVHEGLREGYHKECVKVYRNVQAAFIEENEKQTALLSDAVEKASGKSSRTFVFALLAFLMGLASLVLQLLSVLHVLP